MSVRTEQILSYNPAFDYVRAIASLTVLIAHAGTFVFFRDHYFYVDSHKIFIFETVAALAVEFFFALSGILLGRILYAQFSHKHRRENIRIFLIRRWMRTLPLYYLGLLAYFILYDVNQYEFQITGQHILCFCKARFTSIHSFMACLGVYVSRKFSTSCFH